MLLNYAFVPRRTGYLVFRLPKPWLVLLRMLGVLCAFPASAISAAEPLPFWRSALSHQAWIDRDGAPSDAKAMVQDRTGMLWFGAVDGLFRFDGVRFERMDNIAGHQLLSPNVYSLALFDDALWVGYEHGGISVFDHGAVRHYREAEGVPPSAISQFGRTSDGMTWFSSSAGIYWLDGQRWRQVLPADGLPQGDQSTLNVLQDGGLMVTHMAGLYRNVRGTHHFRRVGDFGSMQPSQVQADGKLNIFKFGETLRVYDPATESLMPQTLPTNGGMPYSVHRDNRNAWWIGQGDGMRLYTPDLQLKKQFLAPHDFSAVRIYRPPVNDREGNLWFITENGVDRIRETRLLVQDMPAGSTDFSIMPGPDGEVWISSHSSKDPISPPTFAIAPDGRRIASDMESATAGARAADGTLWFGDPHYIWSRRDGKVRRWLRPAELKNQATQALAVAADGLLWVSIARRGVHTFSNGAWVAGGGHAELADRTALSLHADEQARLWLGYTGNRMAMLLHDKVQHFGSDDGLAVGNVLAMYSRRGTLWIGGDQGLARFHQGRFIAVNDDAGRPFAGVTGIVETAQGELWMHCAKGLVRISAPQLAAVRSGTGRAAVERFDYLDGYAGAGPQLRPLNTLVESNDGRLWYATSSSVGFIDPRRIARNLVAPTPLITWLSTPSERHRASNGLQLPEHTHNLHIDFTAAVLSIPERARFRTRLIGQDHEWRDAGGLRQSFYTNLGPGDYRFEVMAANEDGVWSDAPASLSFQIAPAFYETTWFKLLCLSMLAAGVYLLYLRRLERMTARVIERVSTRIEERERIARTLHDTFLQSVHGLSLRFQSIKAELPKDDAVQKKIDDALDAADAAAEEGRVQLMDLRVNHLRQGDLASALKTVGSNAAALYGVAFSLNEEGTRCQLQADVQEELFAIAKEGVSNALKHSGSPAVTVNIRYGANSLTLEVCDHGKGLDDTVRQTGQRDRHWGIAGMRERARKINAKLAIHSTTGVGTSVVVTLANVGRDSGFFRRKRLNKP
ncbi:ligand-binding sensor domain-containing protein [Pseudoduganella aquatica]|uniref:ligand-binding sensor domain-containing protein n=1 Tax=Pseudoduganella aquatica TaxID=2660641 RepID=UPI001E2D35B1|nr:sensor histidine kinase [Pseudoduganella aquatica]